MLVPIGTAWNARRVVQHLFRDEILQKLKEGGHAASDGSSWLREYHAEVNQVWESLGDEGDVQEKYGEMAKTWNDVGPPEEAKRK